MWSGARQRQPEKKRTLLRPRVLGFCPGAKTATLRPVSLVSRFSPPLTWHTSLSLFASLPPPSVSSPRPQDATLVFPEQVTLVSTPLPQYFSPYRRRSSASTSSCLQPPHITDFLSKELVYNCLMLARTR